MNEWPAEVRRAIGKGSQLFLNRLASPLIRILHWSPMVVQRGALIEWLNSIEWLRAERITPEADAIIADHLTKIRNVVRDMMTKKGVNAVDAHRIAQTAGHNTPEGEALLDDLFSNVGFHGAGVRESLVATIAAGYCWDFDRELRHFPNPCCRLSNCTDWGIQPLVTTIRTATG
jgi:hypothetical protein